MALNIVQGACQSYGSKLKHGPWAPSVPQERQWLPHREEPVSKRSLSGTLLFL